LHLALLVGTATWPVRPLPRRGSAVSLGRSDPKDRGRTSSPASSRSSNRSTISARSSSSPRAPNTPESTSGITRPVMVLASGQRWIRGAYLQDPSRSWPFGAQGVVVAVLRCPFTGGPRVRSDTRTCFAVIQAAMAWSSRVSFGRERD
jgi:hypothetical protein